VESPDTTIFETSGTSEPNRRPAYDPNNLSPEDEEARKYDDTSEGIDWDEIIATTQDDFLAGRFAYNSADYATQEEADAALDAWLDGIVARVEERIRRELDTLSSCNAAR
jgi:hypothetical protein